MSTCYDHVLAAMTGRPVLGALVVLAILTGPGCTRSVGSPLTQQEGDTHLATCRTLAIGEPEFVRRIRVTDLPDHSPRLTRTSRSVRSPRRDLALLRVAVSPVPTDTARVEPAPSAGGDASAAAQNPIAANISVPLENSFQFGSGPTNETAYVLNLQPVVPIRVGNWNLVNRPIIPIQYMPGPVVGLPSNPGTPVGLDDAFGLGDINLTTFVSPAKAGRLIWGVGPSLTIPTATDELLGSGKWSLGPSLVALTIQKPWLVGILLRHQWSFAGHAERTGVNASVIQPFVNYNLSNGWYLLSSPVFTANWSAPSAERWVVPLGGGVGKIVKFCGKPLNLNLHAYYNVERPTDAPDWQLRFTTQFIFPKK